MAIKYENWEEEYRKCIASPYYFYTHHLVILPENIHPTTRLTEQEFNEVFKASQVKFVRNRK